MAHNTNRRILATPDHKSKPSISMDPTLRKEPKPTPFHTIDNISNQFSLLYANHKLLKSSGLSHPSADNHSKVKSWTDSAAFDSSCRGLTKSKSLNGSSVKDSQKDHDIDKSIIVQKTEAIKKVNVKRALVQCQESEMLKEKSCDEIKKQSLSLALVKGGRWKSFSSSDLELADFFSISGVKVVSVDMPPFMQIHAVNSARKTHDSLEKFTSKALASTLKKEFDGVYGPAWHCIVGTSFGSFVTHSVGGFIYFSMDHKLYVLLFKTTVQKAESS